MKKNLLLFSLILLLASILYLVISDRQANSYLQINTNPNSVMFRPTGPAMHDITYNEMIKLVENFWYSNDTRHFRTYGMGGAFNLTSFEDAANGFWGLNQGIQNFYCCNGHHIFLAYDGTNDKDSAPSKRNWLASDSLSWQDTIGTNLQTFLARALTLHPITLSDSSKTQIDHYMEAFDSIDNLNRFPRAFFTKNDINDFINQMPPGATRIAYLFGYDNSEGENKIRIILIPLNAQNVPIGTTAPYQYFLERTYP